MKRTIGSISIRLDGTTYRENTKYELSSDSKNLDIRALYRASKLEFKAKIGAVNYESPSTLEQSCRNFKIATFLKNKVTSEKSWRLGAVIGARSYPDSTQINRRTVGWESEYDNGAIFGPSIRASSFGERRIISSGIRPSSWSTWNTMEISVPREDNQFVFELENDIWIYDTETSVYNNQKRFDFELYFKKTDYEKPGWLFGVTAEKLSATESSNESYSQSGIKAGIEHFGKRLTFNGTLEIGQRKYEINDLYTDFTYYEIWVMSTLKLSEKMYFDAMFNYVPESHKNEIDNQSLGFGSFQLVYRF